MLIASSDTNAAEKNILARELLYKEFAESNLYKDIELEYKIGDRIADIYMRNGNNRKIAIECQVSCLDIAEFRKRTAYYSYQDIYVLWIFSGNPELDKRLIKLVHTKGSRISYKSSETERKCHRWYYGRIYYLYSDKIYAVHFHPDLRWMPGSCDECLEQAECRDTKRCPKYRTGYFTKSQATREISICPVNNIRLICIDRKDKLRIAKFNEPTWWKV